MDLGLTGQVAVVTGANRGIGLAVTRALVADGAYVAAGSLRTGNLNSLDRVTPVAVNLVAADGPQAIEPFRGLWPPRAGDRKPPHFQRR